LGALLMPVIFLLDFLEDKSRSSSEDQKDLPQQSTVDQKSGEIEDGSKLKSSNKINLTKANKLYREGFNLLNGLNGVAKNSKKGAELLNQAAREGSHEAAYYLASCLYTGKEMGKNPKAALQWFEYAAKLGSPKAKEFLKKLDAYSKENNQ
jgi:TPR repeat protein